MCHRLLIKTPFQGRKKLVKFLRFDNRPVIDSISGRYIRVSSELEPRQNIQSPIVEAGDEIRILFFLHNSLKLQRKSAEFLQRQSASGDGSLDVLSCDFPFV